MMSFAPYPLEDELIYSYMARWFRLSGYRSRRDFMRIAVFREFNLMSPISFGLFDVCTESQVVIDRYDVLIKHTTYPFYHPFLPDPVRDIFAVASWERTSPWVSGWVPAGDFSVRALRCCPICVERQIENHGFTAWLRSHNLPLVEACHIHDVLLESIKDPPGLNTERFLLPVKSKASFAHAGVAEVAYARKAAEVMRSGPVYNKSSTALHTLLSNRLEQQVGPNHDYSKGSMLDKFLMSNALPFMKYLRRTGGMEGEEMHLVPKCPGINRRMDPALMVILLILFFPQTSVSSILEELPESED